MAGTTHEFAAIAFEENLSLRELVPAFPGARLGVRELVVPCNGGEMFLYPFGAIVFHNVSPERREIELARLHRARPGLTTKVVRESFTVREEAGARVRSEERRVGKECRSRWSPYPYKKKHATYKPCLSSIIRTKTTASNSELCVNV